jgi:hypothetical protein
MVSSVAPVAKSGSRAKLIADALARHDQDNGGGSAPENMIVSFRDGILWVFYLAGRLIHNVWFWPRIDDWQG